MESIPALLIEIENARNAFNLESSIFLAERLVQLNPSEEHLNTLAECYLQNSSFSQVCQLLKSCDGERSRYLYALACFKLDKLEKAEQALTSCKKFGVEDFLKNGQDLGTEVTQLGRDFFGGISMGVSSGLMSQKPKTNYSDFYSSNPDSNLQTPLLVAQNKAASNQYWLKWTKKGLNTFTDFFGKKRKKNHNESESEGKKIKEEIQQESNKITILNKRLFE